MHQPATSFGLMLAPCHCGELNPMWLLVPCPLLEATPCHQTSSPVRLLWDLQERGGLGYRAGDGPSQGAFVCHSCFWGRPAAHLAVCLLPGDSLLSSGGAWLPPPLSSCGGCGPSPSGLCSWLPFGWLWVREVGRALVPVLGVKLSEGVLMMRMAVNEVTVVKIDGDLFMC